MQNCISNFWQKHIIFNLPYITNYTLKYSKAASVDTEQYVLLLNVLFSYFTGHLHTFDFHEQRVTLARKEFERHKLGDLVTVKQRDVCQNGFDLENVADAVFLDLPHPWDAIPHAKKGLKFIFQSIFDQLYLVYRQSSTYAVF